MPPVVEGIAGIAQAVQRPALPRAAGHSDQPVRGGERLGTRGRRGLTCGTAMAIK